MNNMEIAKKCYQEASGKEKCNVWRTVQLVFESW